MKRRADDELSEHEAERRRRRTEITSTLRQLDADGALAKLDDMCERWQLGTEGPALTFEQHLMSMFQEFGLNYRDNMLDVLHVDQGSFGLRTVDDRINDAELESIGLYHRMHELGLFPEGEDAGDAAGDDDDGKRSTLRRMLKVLEMVYHAKRIVLCTFQAKLAVHQLHLGDGALDLAEDLDTRLGSWGLRFRYIDNNKTQPLQNLLLYLLDAAMEKRYRKSNGWMYEPVYINGHHMHAWRPVMEISSFVHSQLRKETNWEQWCNATDRGTKNIHSSIEYLTNCHDYQLPELRKTRGVYSFRNGLYIAPEDRFHRFGPGAPPLSEDVVACKFIDTDFDDYTDVPWRDIPTPHLHGILEHQRFAPEVCDWMYILLGRLLYPLNERDGWQVIPMIKGVAATGKCFCRSTPVLMHDGTVRAVETIGVGERVMGDDGTPREVLGLARGVDDMFELVPRRKGFPSVTVTKEHVLCLKYTNQCTRAKWKYGVVINYFDGETRKAKTRKFTVAEEADAFVASIGRQDVFEMTVEEYMALPEYLKRYLVCYRVPVDFAVTEEPLFDPWAIGVWLGDGSNDGPVVTNADEDVMAALRRVTEGAGLLFTGNTLRYRINGPTPARGANTFTGALRAYDLLGNKHVPHALKTGSRETRMEVLAGLLDTDGYKDRCGCYEIAQKCEALADDIVFLARSLGLGASKKEVSKAAVRPDGTRAWGVYHLVRVFGEGIEDIPLRCERKRFAAGELKHARDARKWGFDVVPAGRQDYYGFQTDGNERFVLGDFTVTHNSTIVIKVAKNFFDPNDVGVLSNNIERKFGVGAFHDKSLFVAPEVKSDLAIEQAEFQSMVSGEDTQVNVKHKTAFSVTWTVPGILAGNEVPQWVDNAGSVQRRVIIFEFKRAVINGDMKLGEKLDAELPAILVKCNRAYLEAVADKGHVNIWTILPAYFRKTRDALARAVNSVEAFLGSGKVVFGPDMVCLMEDFRSALKNYEMANNYRSKKYSDDFFMGPFTKYDLEVRRDKRMHQGKMRNADFLFGLSIVEDEDDGNELG